MLKKFEKIKSDYKNLQLSLVDCRGNHETLIAQAIGRDKVVLIGGDTSEKEFFKNCKKTFIANFKASFWKNFEHSDDLKNLFLEILKSMNLSSTEIYKPRYAIAKHQKEALDAWKKNKFKCILEHATGTYKTSTA